MRFLEHLKKNLVAYVALFVALAGTSYAAKPLLTGSDIQDGTVASVDIKDAHLSATDVAPNSLTGGVINESTLAGVDADKLDGHDSTEFVLAGDAGGANGVAGSRHWGQMLLTVEEPVVVGDPLSVGDWTITPTCTGNLSIEIVGPDDYTETLSYHGGFSPLRKRR